jgi:hypothetical protein
MCITQEPLPEPSPKETLLQARRAELAAKIEALPTGTREASRQRAVLRYHFAQLDQALLQDAIAVGEDITTDIAVGLERPMGRMVAGQLWQRPVAQPTNNP